MILFLCGVPLYSARDGGGAFHAAARCTHRQAAAVLVSARTRKRGVKVGCDLQPVFRPPGLACLAGHNEMQGQVGDGCALYHLFMNLVICVRYTVAHTEIDLVAARIFRLGLLQ